MSFSELFFLSLLQGITEFLPISSSAHLILYAEYFGSSKQGITVDVFAHFGTLLAVLIYFRKDLAVIFRTYQIKEFNGLGNCLIIATLPILITGFIFRDFVEIYLRNQNVIIFSTIFFGLLLLLLESFKKDRDLNELNWKDSLIIGCFQIFALLPGASRSAVTIMGAFYLGFKNTTALKISFLLAIPTLCFIFIGENLAINFQYEIGLTNLILISLISFLTAFFTIHFFLKLVDKKNQLLEINEEEEFKKAVNFETNRQLTMYSTLHYKRIYNRAVINEF